MNNNNNIKYLEVKVTGSEVAYQIEQLNILEKRNLVIKTSSLLAPALGSGADLYQEIKKIEAEKMECDELGISPPEDEASVFSLSAVIGTQLDNPMVIEIIDRLMLNTKKDNLPYDPTQEHDDEEFNRYLKLISKSFEVNVLNPLVRCLREMGYSEIVGLAQTIITTRLEKK